jgi:hypothetical protein
MNRHYANITPSRTREQYGWIFQQCARYIYGRKTRFGTQHNERRTAAVPFCAVKRSTAQKVMPQQGVHRQPNAK